jgi:hypothetical protein
MPGDCRRLWRAWVATGQPIPRSPVFFNGLGIRLLQASLTQCRLVVRQEVVIYGVRIGRLLGIFYMQFARRLGSMGLVPSSLASPCSCVSKRLRSLAFCTPR